MILIVIGEKPSELLNSFGLEHMARKIDYENWAKDELIKELRRIKETKYGLVWHRDLPEEKIDVLINPDARTPNEMFPNEMAGRPFPVLKEVGNRAIVDDRTKPTNLLIEGDNYHSLAVLNFTHREAIDLIYIDPPYNTGNDDFVYADKFKSGYIKSDDPFRHSKWISFMERRLKLAKNLLSSKGVIFISIDDNELAPLKMLCDEIFGERNFISCITVYSNPRGRQSTTHIALTHEYLLAYSKSNEAELSGEKLSSEKIREYNQKDDRGAYREIGLRLRGGRATAEESPTLHFPIYIDPKTRKIYLEKARGRVEVIPKFEDGILGTWRWSKRKILEDIDYLLARPVRTKSGERWDIFEKDYLTEDKTLKVKSVWFDKEINYDNGAREIKDLFHKKVFDYAKPTALVKKIINIASGPGSVVLDFMAGSGTTGHAVLELNKEDGGQRQFILCTNNENNICTDVCYPRVKKAIEGYKNLEGEKIPGLSSNLKYYTCDFVEAEPTDRNKRKLVSECTEMLCIRENVFEPALDGDGFKVFKSGARHLGIVFHEDAIDAFKKAITKIKGHCNAYVFSMTDDPHKDQFASLAGKVTLCAIPEVILKVYREIFKES